MRILLEEMDGLDTQRNEEEGSGMMHAMSNEVMGEYSHEVF